MSDEDWLSDEEREDLERARLAIAEGERKAASTPADEEWKAAYRKGWRERNEPWTRPPRESPPPSLALIAHFAYLGRLKASIPGPLVLRDEKEAAEWRKFSEQFDRNSARFDREAAEAAARAKKPKTANPASSYAPKPRSCPQAEAPRAGLHANFPAEFEAGYRYGFTGEFQKPCDAAGYPIGHHTWPLARRNAWYAGFNLGHVQRQADHG